MSKATNDSYDDIINLPHHVSNTHPRMSIENRAAQFSPFAAVVGHDSAIKETARLTSRRIELSEGEIAKIDSVLRIISERVSTQPDITITYYLPDEKKSGGAYITTTGKVKKVDEYSHTLVFIDGTNILIKDILEIELV
ncbi:MAG: hypothetical protein ACK5LL_07615 [Suipraeoptans sp.]